MTFANSDEVRHYLGGIFQKAFNDPEIGQKLVATGIVLQLDYSEPDSTFVVDMASRRVGPAADLPQPTATMSMAATTGNGYWQGKVNLPLAMAKGHIKISGNIASLLKLAPMTRKLYPAYIETLKSDGREDLLV
ncbi:SCP2 sterol-binding domain-containing protein [Nocardioides humilatus]|uniref:SCP2 sterol-binding domain-containing protein n=1 Tax=Nocardioides humilatus TaxID=2607660 RepID=A0A5B1L8P2_9ACTN|nr:SCP2 sterol-binding domain-containing protein [Nocardioides humilatus]KAA1416955.1 SCP2 sterol-binding domain-containing protein [Nocardioides humilatus]